MSQYANERIFRLQSDHVFAIEFVSVLNYKHCLTVARMKYFFSERRSSFPFEKGKLIDIFSLANRKKLI